MEARAPVSGELHLSNPFLLGADAIGLLLLDSSAPALVGRIILEGPVRLGLPFLGSLPFLPNLLHSPSLSLGFGLGFRLCFLALVVSHFLVLSLEGFPMLAHELPGGFVSVN